MKNYYAILEVPVGSDISVIRESYRRLVQENLWNKEVFVELKEAYEVLSTPGAAHGVRQGELRPDLRRGRVRGGHAPAGRGRRGRAALPDERRRASVPS